MDILQYDTIDSTNIEAKRLIQSGKSPGFAVMSQNQTAGKGQYGRVWQTPSGNLALTTVWPLSANPALRPTIALMAGLAIHNVIEPYLTANQRLQIKWPNDILINGAKLSGTLVEADQSAIYIGIGINMAYRPEHVPYSTICLSEFAEVRPDVIAEQLVQSLVDYHQSWIMDGFEPLIPLYQERMFNFGKEIQFMVDRKKSEWIEGQCLGVDSHGRLLIEQADGQVTAHASGDVVIKKLDGSS
ncbi:biotin--[acetyl-CoA-carboxylase] ligase [Paenibacillus sp. DCT19]|uniref:biotin--[acetyl-CoA-carboxylase] ligase n=1 Tax=Paenibacillus sp. DCT19 TaxID=2211212 RepID=UPI000FE23632|nr:biotin--[acetyl-CoA-carboxylase] ligase [Paenibacillus sp. DCT19]